MLGRRGGILGRAIGTSRWMACFVCAGWWRWSGPRCTRVSHGARASEAAGQGAETRQSGREGPSRLDPHRRCFAETCGLLHHSGFSSNLLLARQPPWVQCGRLRCCKREPCCQHRAPFGRHRRDRGGRPGRAPGLGPLGHRRVREPRGRRPVRGRLPSAALRRLHGVLRRCALGRRVLVRVDAPPGEACGAPGRPGPGPHLGAVGRDGPLERRPCSYGCTRSRERPPGPNPALHRRGWHGPRCRPLRARGLARAVRAVPWLPGSGAVARDRQR
mmetsp:Transcript_38545/g.107401  ORF Transcript_38545/g.107401 Transcript_38545/m.107401 type:complete len:273 (-) Transcript_38545:309-1127(-)